MKDPWQAYMVFDRVVEPTGTGPLSGCSFAVKDVFAIAGERTSAGNPTWLATHEAAERHAAVVEQLLAAGARLAGMTHTDELMYSLNGENYHYGTPVNPKAPGRIPGGSSSGSAVAAASGLADFAIGTDTGGSVRIPASYCGVYGFRPTHGAVSVDGLIPLAESFDTVGWMSSKLAVVQRVGEVLLPVQQDEPVAGTVAEALAVRTAKAAGVADAAAVGAGGRAAVGSSAQAGLVLPELLFAEDVLGLADPACRQAFDEAADVLAAKCKTRRLPVLAKEGYAVWMDAFRMLQGLEIWRNHGTWITQSGAKFGPGIAERFAWSATLTEEQCVEPAQLRQRVMVQLAELLGTEGVLVLPTAPGPAPLLGQSGEALRLQRERTLQMSCLAGLAGLPQLTLPWLQVDGCPVGLSLIAGPGMDRELLRWAGQLEAVRAEAEAAKGEKGVLPQADRQLV